MYALSFLISEQRGQSVTDCFPHEENDYFKFALNVETTSYGLVFDIV